MDMSSNSGRVPATALFGTNAGSSSNTNTSRSQNPIRNAPPKKKGKSKVGTSTNAKAGAGAGKGRGKGKAKTAIRGNGTQSLSQWIKPKQNTLFTYKTPPSPANTTATTEPVQDQSRRKIIKLSSPNRNQIRKSSKKSIKTTPNSKLQGSFVENQNQIIECISPGSTKVYRDEINADLLNDLLDIEVSNGDSASSALCSSCYIPSLKDLNINIDQISQNMHLWDKYYKNNKVDDIILKGCELDRVMEKVDLILYQGSLSRVCLCGNTVMPRKKVDDLTKTPKTKSNFTKSLKSTPILDNFEKNRVSIPSGSGMKNTSNENDYDVTFDFGDSIGNTSKVSNNQQQQQHEDFYQFDNGIMMDIDVDEQEMDQDQESKVLSQTRSKSDHDNINIIEDSCTDFEESIEKDNDTTSTRDEKQQQQQTNSLFPDEDDDFLAELDLDFEAKKRESQNSEKSNSNIKAKSNVNLKLEKQDESTTVETIDESVVSDTDRIFKDFKTPESLKKSFSLFKPIMASSPMPLNCNTSTSTSPNKTTQSPIIHRSSLVIKADLNFEEQDSCRDLFSPSPSKPLKSHSKSKNESLHLHQIQLQQLSPEIIYSSSQKRSQKIRQKLEFSKIEDSKENEEHIEIEQPPLSPEIRIRTSSKRISISQKYRDQEKILDTWYADYWNKIQPELEEKELNIIERKRELEIEETGLIKLRTELAEAEKRFSKNKDSLEVDEREFSRLKTEVESKKEKYERDNLLISHHSQGFQIQNSQPHQNQCESQTQFPFIVQSQNEELFSKPQEYALIKTPKSKFVFKKKELTPLPPSFPNTTTTTTTNKNNLVQVQIHQSAKNQQQPTKSFQQPTKGLLQPQPAKTLQNQPAKSLQQQQNQQQQQSTKSLQNQPAKGLLQQQKPAKSLQQQQQNQQKPSTSTTNTNHKMNLNAKNPNEIFIVEDSSDDDFINDKPIISTKKRKKPQDKDKDKEKKQVKVKLPKKKYRRVIKNPFVSTQAGCDSDNEDDSNSDEEEIDDSFVTNDDVAYTETQQVRYLMKKESPITSASNKFSKPYEAARNLVSRGIDNSDEEQYEEDSFCNDDVEYEHIGDYTQAIMDAKKDNEEEARLGGPRKRKLRIRK